VTDDDGQRGRVHEVHVGHVEDQPVAAGRGFRQVVVEPLARHDVKLAVDTHDHAGTVRFHREAKLCHSALPQGRLGW
jgi:hypothetical protein